MWIRAFVVGIIGVVSMAMPDCTVAQVGDTKEP